MSKLKSLRPCLAFLPAMVVWLAVATPAQAQETTPGDQSSWVTNYALVILCVGLALFVICRPSRREKKVRKE